MEAAAPGRPKPKPAPAAGVAAVVAGAAVVVLPPRPDSEKPVLAGAAAAAAGVVAAEAGVEAAPKPAKWAGGKGEDGVRPSWRRRRERTENMPYRTRCESDCNGVWHGATGNGP